MLHQMSNGILFFPYQDHHLEGSRTLIKLFLRSRGCLMSSFILWYHMLGNTSQRHKPQTHKDSRSQQLWEVKSTRNLPISIISSPLGTFTRLISICGKTMHHKLSEATPSICRIHLFYPSLIVRIVALFDDIVWFCGIKVPKPLFVGIMIAFHSWNCVYEQCL